MLVNAANLSRPVVNNSTTSFPIESTAEPHASNQLEKLLVLSGTRVQMAALMCKEGYVRRFPFDARCYDGRLSSPLRCKAYYANLMTNTHTYMLYVYVVQISLIFSHLTITCSVCRCPARHRRTWIRHSFDARGTGRIMAVLRATSWWASRMPSVPLEGGRLGQLPLRVRHLCADKVCNTYSQIDLSTLQL